MKSIIKGIIADFHQLPLPAFKRRQLDVPVDIDKIITVIGPRRAGKTYYLYQLMADLAQKGVAKSQILYINFEDERIVLDNENDLIFDAYRELYPFQDLSDVYVFFDEIQELPGWEKFVRRVYDTVSKHIFLSGSNAKLLSKEIATALRGRSISFELLPLSFSEYLYFQNIATKDRNSSHSKALIENAFQQYCLWGGYPEVVGLEDRFKVQVLQEYFNVMLYRDLIERYQIKDASVLKFVVKRLVGSFTKEFSVNKLYNDLKSRGFAIGKESLYKMVAAAFSIYMLASVERYEPAVVKREMSNKKIYLFDNGFASALNYLFSEDTGKRLENVLFQHIRAKTENIFFMRNGWECDFAVFPRTGSPQLFQVTNKLDHDNIEREMKGLEAGKKMVNQADCHLLYYSAEKGLKIPKWVNRMSVVEWLI